MGYYWLNTGNMIETNGPFATLDKARENAEMVYANIGDIASCMALIECSDYDRPVYNETAEQRFNKNEQRLKQGKVVLKGHIGRDHKWHDGPYPEEQVA